MTARKIRNSWWVDFRIDHTRHRMRSPENSRPGALAFEALLRQKMARGENIGLAGPVPTFATFSETWFRDYVLPNNKFSEQRKKRSILRRHLLPFFGRMRVDEITTHRVEQFKAHQVRNGVAGKSLTNQLTTLNKCLSCAHDWLDLRTKRPRVTWPKSSPMRTEFLSAEECDLLLDHSRGIVHELVLVALRTGMRQGELKGLQWNAIDWQNRSLTVRHSYCDVRKVLESPKSNRERHIPLDAEVLTILYQRRQATGFVFLDGHQPFNSPRINGALASVCARAEMRRVTWHVLRHTFATSLAMRGVPLQIVQQLLGHSSVKTTERYAHVAPSMLRSAIDLLNAPERGERQMFGQPAGNAWLASQLKEKNSQAA